MKKILALTMAVLLWAVSAQAVIIMVQITPAAARPDLTNQEWRRGSGAYGDVIDIKRDDWILEDPRFGTYECWKFPFDVNYANYPNQDVWYGCVEIQSTTYAEVQAFMEENDTYYSVWQLQVDEMQTNKRNELFSQGYTSGPAAQMKGWFCNKETNLTFTGGACTPYVDIP